MSDKDSEKEVEEESYIPSGSTPAGVPYANIRNRLNHLKTKSLFLEHNYHNESTDPAPFTLQPFDYKGKISLKRLYMECADPTEYSFACHAFGSWEHWQKLAGSGFFQSTIDAWRMELEVMLRSKAIKDMVNSSASNAQAARWVAEKGWAKSDKGRGRPSNEEVERERKIQAQIRADLAEDASRLFDDYGNPLH